MGEIEASARDDGQALGDQLAARTLVEIEDEISHMVASSAEGVLWQARILKTLSGYDHDRGARVRRCHDAMIANSIAALAGQSVQWWTDSTQSSADDRDVHEFAEIEFEPCDPEIVRPFTDPAFRGECKNFGMALRLAASLLTSTKPQMTDQARRLIVTEDGMDTCFEMVRYFRDIKDWLNDFAGQLESACAKEIISMAAAATQLDASDGNP